MNRNESTASDTTMRCPCTGLATVLVAIIVVCSTASGIAQEPVTSAPLDDPAQEEVDSPMSLDDEHDAAARLRTDDLEALRSYTAARYALATGDPGLAVQAFRATVAARPDLPHAWLGLSEALEADAKYQDAFEAAARAGDFGAPAWQVAMRQASVRHAEDDARSALDVFHTAATEGAPDEFFHEWYRMAMRQSDKLARRRAAAAWATQYPDRPDPWMRLGYSLRDQGYGTSAIEPFLRAGRTTPGDPRGLDAAAVQLMEDGSPQRGREVAAECLERYPSDVGCNIAMVRVMHHLDEQGVADIDSELDVALLALAGMSSSTPTLFRQTATRLRSQTSARVAMRYARRVVQLRPYNRNLTEQAAWVAVETGHHDDSLALFERVLLLDPGNFSALNYLGYTLAERNERLDEAEEYVRRALVLRPDDPNIRDSLAWVFYRQGRFEDALEVQEAVAADLGDNAVILDHLGDIYEAVGRIDDARDAWRRALQIADSRDEDVLETVPAKLERTAGGS